MMQTLASLFLLVLSFSAQANEGKGTFYVEMGEDPTTLNPITAQDADSGTITGLAIDALATRDDDTYDWVPLLAEKWEASKDGKSYTFHLRQGVKFSDGTPVTAEDVKYSFDVYFEGRFEAPHKKVYLENIQECKILDPKTVQFIVKQPYYLNEDVLTGLEIIPKHVYGAGDPKDPKFNKTVTGAGPYIFEEWEKGQKIMMKKNPHYWAEEMKIPYFMKRNHFARRMFRIIRDPNISLERFKHGDIDYLGLLPEQYMKKTDGPEWGKTLIKVKTTNSAPQNYSYGYIGWNEANPIFKEKETRQALTMLVNRDFMIEKFLYNMSEKAVGPLGNKSPSTSPKVKPIPYNPKGALELLKKVGWKLGPNGLTRSIGGKETPFEFTLMSANTDFEKYATVIKEDMKAVGVTMNYKYLEWNSFMKLIDERKFDAVNLGWQVNSLENDPKQIFHSASIPSPGHNFVSYSNPALDKLIDQMRVQLDKKKRQKLFWKISETIADDQPYTFLFNRKFSLYAHNARIKTLVDTYKYAIGADTWSVAEGQ